VAKRSRGAPQAVPAGARPSATTTRRTRQVRRGRDQTVLERYRSLLIGGTALAGVLIIGFFVFQSSTRAGWECASLLTPGPVESLTPRPSIVTTPAPTASAQASPTTSPQATSPQATSSPSATASPESASPDASPTAEPTPAPEPTARLGFSTTDMGRQHITNAAQSLRYNFCPPTSGEHYSIAGQGPIRAAVYGPTEQRSPGGWIHNLEHGYVVALYRCSGPDDCPSEAEMAELQRFFDEAPDSGVANCPTKVLVARFDSLDTRFALLAWNRALLLDEFDVDTALSFAQQWLQHAAVPERTAC